MTTATAGTGTITLGSAKAGYLTFAEAGVANADTVTYVLVDGNDFEIGTGTYTSSGTTMSRDTVTVSKISGTAGTTKLTLSGTAEVFLSGRAAETAFLDRAQTWTASQTMLDLVLDGAIDEEEFTITDAAAFVIDPSNGSLQKITLGASRTPAAAPAGWTAGKGLVLKIADGTAYTITWTTLNVTWVGGTAPTLATTGWTVVALWKDADAIYGRNVGNVA
jgi:hypothetical protein